MLERLRNFYNKNRISGQKVNAEQNISKASHVKEAEEASEEVYSAKQSEVDRKKPQH